MKKRLLSILLGLIVVLSLISCSNSSNTNETDSDNDKNVNKTFYFDKTQMAFVGQAEWTPKNTYQQVLLGYEGLSDYVEKVEWKASHPYDSIEYSGWTAEGSYSINSDFTKFTASIRTNHNDVFAWADIPNVVITVTIYFTTGESVVIGRQTGYSGYEGEYPTDIDSYLCSSSMRDDPENYLKASVSDKRIKIKSATAYLPDGSTHTASFDWTYPDFDSYTSFDPIVRRRYASDYILRLVMETLEGTTIDIDRSLRGKRYRGYLTINSQIHYIEINFVEVNQVKCYEYTDETFVNVTNEYDEGCYMQEGSVGIRLFETDINCFYSNDNWESIGIYIPYTSDLIGTLNIVN